ncbi:hypothetical protein PUNSTDRAFT_137098 [Punctularia strigosozonata HHB-11173 SS5]|uniref:uncharacterized protein n=1 Tax=Punctularia strigosozonata (strain HHB-11173) TaxID=741275 RepID=UPI000441713E|nr:uncharacterized protein PUNSTDRAFT_137098 [Punctularia strigosozonata HHB-11173 SS5]EIN06321.1 hypothetical protein PUNSTDRAFT_137098 [Punctularia strigosozonata HHB-11173 SS5]
MAQSILASISFRRFRATGASSYIESAIDLQRLALKWLVPTASHEKHRYLRYLGWYIYRRWESFGGLANLDEAISALEESMKLCPTTHIDRVKVLQYMIAVLENRYFSSGIFEDLEKALDLGRRYLLTERSEGRRDFAMLNSIGNILDLHHQLTLLDGNDIEESISLRRKALDCLPPRWGNRWSYLDSLGFTLRLRFSWSGEVADLEEAIEVGRQAVEAVPDDHPRRFHAYRNLAEALVLRFNDVGDTPDLNEALQWDRDAMASIAPSDTEYSDVALAVVSHRCIRFNALRTEEDLEVSISLSQGLLSSLPAGDVNKPVAAYSLAKALLLRGQSHKAIADIDRAVEVLGQVADGLSQRIDGQDCTRTLAACHLARFRIFPNTDDALHALRITMNHFSAVGRRDRYQCHIDAAQLYLEPGTPYQDLAIALQHLTDALMDNNRDVRTRIQDGANIMRIVESVYDIFADDQSVSSQLLDVYVLVVSLLPGAAFLGVHLRSRLHSLSAGQTVALKGACHALNLSLPNRALEILEQGRASFWTNVLQMRSQFDGVPDQLRDQLTSIARQLDIPSNDFHTPEDPRVIEAKAAQRRRRSEEFSSLLHQVRSIPGMEHFLLRHDSPTLSKTAQQGPVVVLVSSTLGCHAVIIEQSGTVVGVPLTQITYTWLVESGATWRSAMSEARSMQRLKLLKMKNRSSGYNMIDDILRHLWMNAVHPVLNALHIKPSSGRRRPRLWWCPTGQFIHLPIHAAGFGTEWCSDFVVSSYIPTLQALLAARETYEPIHKQNVRALVAAVPQSFTHEWHDLPSTREEARVVQAALPPGTSLTSFDTGSGGTSAATLLRELPHANVLHLACHGYQDQEDPLRSGFVMQDEMVTIERLIPTPIPRAFMAFLSACETAKGDTDQPDHVVHLAATMLFSGFKSVIATLWSMEDMDGPIIAKVVYETIFGGESEMINPDDVAYALDTAVQQLRKKNIDPSRWASFIHLGL